MRVFKICAPAVAIALASAAAATAAPHQTPLTSLRVSTCQLGLTSKDRLATFYARMRAVARSERMWMRFQLYERIPGERPVPVDSPALAVWRRSHAGVEKFGYSQTVNGLEAGGTYTMLVDFRWYDAQGHLLRASERSSSGCRELGPLADLKVAGLSARAGPDSGSETYSLVLENTGGTSERATTVALLVDGVPGATTEIPLLTSGELRRVTLKGAVCLHRIRAVVERAGAERHATVLNARCPSVR